MAKVQVILTADVAGQGRKGEIVNVSEGYAHNFLVKGNKGIIATPEEMKKVESRKRKEAKRLEETRLKAVDLKNTLESKALTISVKTGDNGKLFGAVTNKEVAAAIQEAFDVKIDKKKIEANVKSLGEHKVPVKLHTEVKAEVKVLVVAK